MDEFIEWLKKEVGQRKEDLEYYKEDVLTVQDVFKQKLLEVIQEYKEDTK